MGLVRLLCWSGRGQEPDGRWRGWRSGTRFYFVEQFLVLFGGDLSIEIKPFQVGVGHRGGISACLSLLHGGLSRLSEAAANGAKQPGSHRQRRKSLPSHRSFSKPGGRFEQTAIAVPRKAEFPRQGLTVEFSGAKGNVPVSAADGGSAVR